MVVTMAKRMSLISWRGLEAELPTSECRVGLLSCEGERRRGRHFAQASRLARQGWICRGYENMTRMTMAKRPIVAAAAVGYIETMLPLMLSP
jgi:hypothetical protein